ncbi:BREX-1 system adenine-specific DNA-methyltransferase PglX [Bacteroides ovatus]|uniref:BREX-1 system adenine-specific DNA-methyltransferase PglX n=1 Tax=Bacteroides ovatus TaxID=28116 RepID=UPI00234C4222|nr:BREX-1 system adenine-specific DNA-methyltransferase PglX [Bacteroides ovatus]MDC7144555.1 BREX-1 system adenine-specific DNA-methyltransferase PglX [Bacteroides ovatus]
MDTNRLKKFAIEARNILKAGIAAKLTSLGFDNKGEVAENLRPQLLQGGTLWNGRTLSEGFFHQWMRLYEEVQAKGVNEVYEQAAYTWFNRLVAIRILQKNGLCEPVSTYADSAHTPQIVNQARQGLFPPMEEASKRHLLELLDDDTKVTEQFAVLLVAWCHANPILQRCFGTMEDYTELLLPANILAENGFIDLLNHTEFITDEEFRSPELIGWLYQFYISERKDEVFAKKGKFEADEIPAATQIFTPNWIVKYMVQNTVGRIYLDNNPYTTLAYKEKWQYLVEPAEPTPAEAILHYNELTDLKVADLACGSGHILNECFDLLYDLYITEGYTRVEAITHIFRDNLTGIDLDPRAQQLSLFALTLKACQRDHSFADAHCLPRVLTMPKVQLPLPTDTRLAVEIDAVNTLLKDAESLGSIMKFDLTPAAREWVVSLVAENEAAALVIALTERYDALVMNPPYMGGGNMNEALSKYVKKNYEDGKTDLFSVFMEVAIERLKVHGLYGMINMQSWMFLSSFEKLRKTLLDNYHIENMLHLGPRTFDELSGEVVQNTAFVVAKHSSSSQGGTYFRLVDGKCCADKEQMFLHAAELEAKIYYPNVPQANFEKIPGCPIGYWVSEKILTRFARNLALSAVAKPCVGLQTADNARFLRYWHEVNLEKIGFGMKSAEEAKESGLKWFPYNKGGNQRRWYGNQTHVVNWENDGEEIKSFKGAVIRNPDCYFKSSLSWSDISSTSNSFKVYPDGFIFDVCGMSCFNIPNRINLLGVLNTKFIAVVAKILNPTMHFQIGDFKKLPYLKIDKDGFNNLVSQNIAISKLDWDSHETSWDFQQNELISLIDLTEQDLTTESVTALCSTTAQGNAVIQQTDESPHAIKLQDLVERYHQKWNTLFMQLHSNEEELNRQFIDIYGLQDELTPDVSLNEITILQQEEVSIEGNALKWHDEVILKQLLSYAVGVWMGRYRLDKPGLHIAHPHPIVDELVPYTYNGHTIEIDDDGIFPLMAADSGFTDNACLRTAQFVSDVFGAEHQVENLNYIEHTLGKTIELYWQKDFWKDHKKMYQNRPIYWLFASKKGTFQCIAYLHRMTPYTPERIRSKYLLPFIETLSRKIADLTTRAVDLSTAERKKLDILNKQLEECREYHDRLAVVAEQVIPLDLDDGVVVNYAKLGDVVAKLK